MLARQSRVVVCVVCTRFSRTDLAALAVVLAALLFAPAPRASAQATNADALWQIVSTCVEGEAGDYCACPAFVRSCCGDEETPDADVVWARTDAFVAIRDMLMCGCAPGFVAGLALPLARVSGIGDPHRPEGIWPFAWKIARTRIADELEIGLVINPKDARTQNQMHVHMLRLRPGVRAWLDGDPPAPPGGAIAVGLADLDAVFAAVEAKVGAARMDDSGILVARRRGAGGGDASKKSAGDGWIAVITERHSPQVFTSNDCLDEAELAPGSARATPAR